MVGSRLPEISKKKKTDYLIGFIATGPPVALKGRSGPGRSLDRRFKRITYEKKQNLMNLVLYIGSN